MHTTTTTTTYLTIMTAVATRFLGFVDGMESLTFVQDKQTMPKTLKPDLQSY